MFNLQTNAIIFRQWINFERTRKKNAQRITRIDEHFFPLLSMSMSIMALSNIQINWPRLSCWNPTKKKTKHVVKQYLPHCLTKSVLYSRKIVSSLYKQSVICLVISMWIRHWHENSANLSYLWFQREKK